MTDADASPDLLTRRRLETRHEIHLAALALFETQGVRETTVAQIAERAGVSSRTFFRYFTSKEQAGLPGQRRMLEAIDTLRMTETDAAAILRAIEEAIRGVIGRESDPELKEHQRVARLLGANPDLQALAGAQERALAIRLRTRLTELAPRSDPLELLVISEIAIALWRASWDRWGELAIAGETTDPAELYRRCRAVLERLVG